MTSATPVRIDESVTVGPQPSDEDLLRLRDEGFSAVVSLRTANEEGQPLSPREEGVLVQEAGLLYVNIPVAPSNWLDEQVDDYRSKLSLLPTPVFVHCGSGRRAGAFAILGKAVDSKWSGEETLRKARELGFDCDGPEIADFVRSYVDAHSAGE